MKINVFFLLLVFAFSKGLSQVGYDSNFGNQGLFVQEGIDFGGTEDIAFQGDDKIIAQTYIQLDNGATVKNLFRVNLNGTLDPSFADNGVFAEDTSNIIFNAPGALVVAEDAIYTVSSLIPQGGNRTDITVTKLTADGTLDSNFGTEGYSTIPSPSDTEWTDGVDMKIDNNGDIVVVGLTEISSTGDRAVLIVKFLSDGTLDMSFGTNGIYQLALIPEFEQSVTGVLINDDNSIFVIGNLIDLEVFNSNTIVTKLNPNGSIDTSFGENGSYITDNEGDFAASYGSLLEDKSILLYGFGFDVSSNYKGMSTRINADGKLDNTYGDSGVGESFIGGPDIVVNYAQMIPAADSYILIGDVLDFTIGYGVRRILVSKLNLDGTFDTSYGTEGTNLFDSPVTEYTDIRGRSVIASGEDFYIACEVGLPNTNINPAITKLTNTMVRLDELDQTNIELSLYPNPVGNTTTLLFNSKLNTEARISIKNMLGQEISSRSFEMQLGENNMTLQEEMSALSDGVYVLNLIINETESKSIKFIK